MILSHANKFIFLKTTKVAGTSLEIALSKYGGNNDIITPINVDDEASRKQLGYLSAQNYLKSIFKYDAKDFGKLVLMRTSAREFHNHITAADIKERVGKKTWDSYLKFSIVRNPFDYAVSRYFWEQKRTSAPTDFRTFLLTKPEMLLMNRKITHIDGKSVVDFMVRYENFESDLTELSGRLNLPGSLWDDFRNISAKGAIRPVSASADEMFFGFQEGIDLIRIICGEEIEKYGYAIPKYV